MRYLLIAITFIVFIGWNYFQNFNSDSAEDDSILLLQQSDELIELYWEDLVPIGSDEVNSLPMDHQGDSMVQQMPNAPVVEEFNQRLVKVPGFVVPLAGDSENLTEFLLVPFMGACIHVPPPPSNQIIHVTFPSGAPVNMMYDAIYVTGRFSTKRWEGDIASVGYSLEGTEISLYGQ